VVESRYTLAALACLSAFFMKSTGLIGSLAVILYLASAWIVSRLTADNMSVRNSTAPERRRMLRGVVWNVLALVVGIGIYAWGDVHSRLMRVGFAGDWIAHAWRVCPDLLLLAIATLLLGFATLSFRLWHARRAGATWHAIARDWLLYDAALPLALLLVIGDLAAMRLYARVFVIRYVLLAVPFLYLLLAAIAYRPRWGRWNLVLPVALIGLNIYNANGRLFPDAGGHARHCAPLERSREYLEDHRSQIAAMRALAAQDDAVPIVAGYPFSHYLSFPRLGYVDKPLRGYAIMPLVSPTFRSIYELLRDRPQRLRIISVDNPSHRVGSVYAPPPSPGDHIVYDDHQVSPLVIYDQDLTAVAAQPGGLEAWYLENLWGGAIQRFGSHVWQVRAEELVAVGRPDLATRLLERRVAAVASDFASRIQLAQLYLAAGRGAETAQLARDILDAAQTSTVDASIVGHGHLLLGQTLLQQRQLDAASAEFNAALRLDPTLTDARVNLGVADLLAGRLTESERQFQAALAERPEDAGANYHLGLIWSTQGRDAEAERAFERAIQGNPKHFDALQQLAERRRKSRQSKEALEYYRRGIAVRPDWLDGVNWSAWIMATSSDAALRDGPSALELAEQVCRVSAYGNATALDTLAAAHAECGQFEQAVQFAQKALAVLPANQQASLGEPIRKRLELYRRGQPYRES
jgi:tetratricopeptide (TPR) repeat protein